VRTAEVRDRSDHETISFEALLAEDKPIVLRGLLADRPLVEAGRISATEAVRHILSFWNGRPVVGYTAPPESGGRFFYDEALTKLDFTAQRVPLDQFLGDMLAHLDDPAAPAFYIGSTDLDQYLPGFRSANDAPLAEPMFDAHPPTASIWIGNRTVAAAHWDVSNNIAVCMAGRRRFTLFPPDQVANLYPGPLEPTPGGQVVSMVDLRAPDLARYPRVVAALDSAIVAELEPGDVLVYPALWWHQVEALESFNVLVNYWWNRAPADLDQPMTTLLSALLSLRDRPEQEKHAWHAMFDYYVFGDPALPREHLPDHVQGALGPMAGAAARRLRAQLLQRLNR
jgi:hypothetical protein